MPQTVTRMNRCDLIALSGRYDSTTAPDLEATIQASLDSGVHRIVLDMAEVEFFSSAAIRVLVMAYKACRKKSGGDVRLSNLPERIEHVLDLAGILPLVQVFDDNVLAVGSF